MADNITDTVVNHLVRDRNGLFRVTGVIIFHRNQFVAVNAAFGVDIFNRLSSARELHVAVLRHRT